jgi:hypothetical protein
VIGGSFRETAIKISCRAPRCRPRNRSPTCSEPETGSTVTACLARSLSPLISGPPRIPLRTDGSSSLTNSPRFAGLCAEDVLFIEQNGYGTGARVRNRK